MSNIKRNSIIYSMSLHIFFTAIVIAILLPLFLVIAVSFTDETTIFQSGYSFFPKKMSWAAYQYLFNDAANIINAYGISVTVTLIGTVIGLFITALYAYPLSRRDFPLRNKLAFFVFFTLLFNGGLVPWYLIFTTVINVKNSIWGLIVPGLLMNGFNVLIMRTFFQNTIPESVIESATIEGAGELRIWWQIVLPLSLPVMATIGLFYTLAYWNDWFNSMIFISKLKLYSLQYVMQKTLLDVQFLSLHSENSNTSAIIAKIPTETVRMAMAIIGAGPIILAYPFFQRYFIKGLTVGSVKG